jgi:hypothetical protein
MSEATIPQLEALARLLTVAHGDTGQCRRVADFLLAWYNADENGGWGPADLWSLDKQIGDDVMTVIGLIRSAHGYYPGDHGFRREIERVWELWRAKRKRGAPRHR